MIYGSKIFKNGKKTSYLKFDTGKIVKLNEKESKEFDITIKLWMRSYKF